MRTLILLTISLTCLTVAYAAAEDWVLVYSNDFAADPFVDPVQPWTTNDVASYYWNSSDSTLFIQTVNASHGYATVGVPQLPSVGCVRLEYDLMPVSIDWGASIYFGFYDLDRDIYSASYLHMHWGSGDLGYGNALTLFECAGGQVMDNHYPAPPYSFGTWYHHNLTYNSITHVAQCVVTERDGGTPYDTFQVTAGVDPCDLFLVGSSSVGHLAYPGRQAFGYIDNVRVYVSAAGGPSAVSSTTWGAIKDLWH